MDSRDLVLGIMLLSVSAIGILGNFSLLSRYQVLYFKESTLRSTVLILTHLTVANTLNILSKGVPQTLAAFGLKELFTDWVCDLLLYVHRLGRSVSIGTTCLLSVFQASTISSGNSCWKNLQVKAPKCIGLSLTLCWILYMVVNIIFPAYVLNNKLKNKNKTAKSYYGYCTTAAYDGIMGSVYTALFAFPEVLFSVLMLWSSGSMVVTLYRHKQRVQHIRSTNVSSRSSPESRATQNILALVSTFVGFYSLSSILNACAALLNHPPWWLTNINSIVSMCFPSFAPFVLLSKDSSVSRLLCFVCIRIQKIC